MLCISPLVASLESYYFQSSYFNRMLNYAISFLKYNPRIVFLEFLA